MGRTLTFCMSILCLAGSAGQARGQDRVLHYEPVIVQLTGVVKLERHFGPPGFGASPETDAVRSIPVLILDSPVNVVGDPPGPRPRGQVNSDNFSNVTHMQMIFEDTGTDVMALAGKRVMARGTLFEKVSGGNYTDVLMQVLALRR